MAKEFLVLQFQDLPIEAQKCFSPEQLTFLDEFTFKRFGEESNLIEAWYAGDVLAVWDDQGWKEPYLFPNPRWFE